MKHLLGGPIWIPGILVEVDDVYMMGGKLELGMKQSPWQNGGMSDVFSRDKPSGDHGDDATVLLFRVVGCNDPPRAAGVLSA